MTTTADSPAHDIVFIDSRVPDLQAITAATRPGVKVVILDPNESGVTQMAKALEGEHGLASISVVSHGDEGLLLLGNGPLFSGNLQQYQAELQAIGAALGPDGDLLLYGCDVGAGDAGAQFVQALAQLTGADVAASNDSTAGAVRGGNWDLEITTGQIEAAAVLDAQSLQGYDASLHTASVNSVTQLKAAIAAGYNDGQDDIITLTGNISFASAADAISINVTDGKTMSIAGGNFTLSGANFARVLNITGGSVAIDHLTISSGKITGTIGSGSSGAPGASALGAGISVTGAGTQVTLLHSSIASNTAKGGAGAGNYSGGIGGSGGQAAGGLYIGSGATVQMATTSVTGNSGTGGNGGYGDNQGGNGGNGTGGVLVASGGMFRYESGSVSIGSNTGTGGTGGGSLVASLGTNGVSNANISGTADNTWTYTPPAPTVTGVTSTAGNGTYKVGDVVAIQINFSEAVTVTGTPQITLETGITDRTINYASGTGTSTLTFNYTVQAGDTTADLDYVSATALALNSGTLSNASGTNAVLTLPALGAANSLGANKNIVVDGLAPTVTNVSSSTANGTYKVGDVISVQVNFSEAVTVTGTPQLTLETGTADQTVSYASGTGTSTLTFAYTVQAGDTTADLDYFSTTALQLNSGSIKDAAGNAAVLTLASPGAANSLGANKNFVVDGVVPTVTSINRVGTATSNATSVDYTVTFSESVTGVDASDFTLAGTATGTVAAVSGSGSTYTVTVNGIAGEGPLRLDLKASGTGITDGAGNAIAGAFSSGQSYTFDHTAPSAPSSPVLDAGSDSGSSNTDNITNATTPTFTGTAESGSTVTLYDTDGTTVLGTGTATGGNWSITSSTLAQGAHTLTAKATDTAGNVSLASAALNVTVDTTAPTITFSGVALSADTGASSTDLITNTAAQTISATLNAAPTVGDIVYGSLDNGATWTDITSKVSGTTLSWTGVTLAGSDTLKLRVTDVAGNDGATTSAAYVLDTAGPTTSVATVAFSADTGASSTDFITKTAAQTVSGTLSANLAAGESVLVSLDNGATWTAATATVGSNAWSLAGQTLSASDTLQIKVVDFAGNDGSMQSMAYIYDTTAPAAPTAPVLSAISDSGISNLDRITSVTTPTFTGTAEAGSTVTLYDTDGTTVLGTATADGGGNWSITSSALTEGAHALNAKATDLAGNVSVASAALIVTIDPSPPTFASATVDGNQLVLSYTEVTTLDAVNVPAVGAFAVVADGTASPVTAVTVNAAAKTVTLTLTTAVVAGQVVTVAYTDPTGGNDVNAIQDAAGNDAASLVATAVTNNTAAPPPPPAPPTPVPPPAPTPTIVDGASLVTVTGDDGTTTTTIAPVTPGRVDDPQSANTALADVPLAQSGGNTLLLASLPVGFGLTASTSGITTAGNSLTDLIGRIQGHTASGSQDQSQLASGGASFLDGLASSTPVLVQTIVPTFQGSGTPGQGLGLSGQPAAPGQPLTALVIDASALPSGSSLLLNNVEFAAIIGSVSVSGGAGSQHVWGDSASQTILLGADDDVLHGGGGNDTVGSLGGNDQLFGDAGDDIVFGGTGHDILSGGAGNDRLDGGLGWDTALQSGSLADYSLSQEGRALVLTHKTTGEVDHLKSVEMIKFDSGASLYIADSDAEAALAHIATRWLHRDLTPEEGAQAQLNSHLSALQIAQAVLRGPYGEQLQGHSAEELIAGWQNNPQILRMDVTPETLLGTAGLDAIGLGLQLANVHLQRLADGVWEGTDLRSGSMSELHGIERLHFKDASVALDGANLAALIAVTLGEASLQSRAITSEGLALMDSGWSSQAIGAAALQLAMGTGAHTAQETVQWLWTQSHGRAGSAEQLQPYVQQLQSDATTVGDLAWEAAQYALANPQVTLAGVLQQGLVYEA